jgi:UDP-N-acetylmuramoyl-tripeptide--D-alanyl-D-alanine ligase
VRISASEAAGILNIPPPGEFWFSGVAVDSRRVESGNLFVALSGARADGHDFVTEAIRRGAAAALVARRPEGLPGTFPLLLVPDPLAALQNLASEMRRRWNFRLAAVTGSVGKTTTKELAAAILARRFRTARTPGNANSGIGFPQAILNLTENPEVLVGEMGMSSRGEIGLLSRLFGPEVAAITNVAAAHSENFPSIDAIADAKWEILEGLTPGGALVFNAGDARLAARAARFAGRKVSFGFAGADVGASSIESRGLDGSDFQLETPAGNAPIRLPLAGRHQIANFLCAAALALALGGSPSDAAEAAPKVSAPPHRGEIVRLSSGATLVDDSYNSSPSAVAAGLSLLAESRAARRIAVLGDMRELGESSADLHRLAGRAAARVVDRLICVGTLSGDIAAGAALAGLDPRRIEMAGSAEDAAELLAADLRPGDLVWIKGSRAVGLERAVAELAR